MVRKRKTRRIQISSPSRTSLSFFLTQSQILTLNLYGIIAQNPQSKSGFTFSNSAPDVCAGLIFYSE